jgi:hypothetical protein
MVGTAGLYVPLPGMVRGNGDWKWSMRKSSHPVIRQLLGRQGPWRTSWGPRDRMVRIFRTIRLIGAWAWVGGTWFHGSMAPSGDTTHSPQRLKAEPPMGPCNWTSGTRGRWKRWAKMRRKEKNGRWPHEKGRGTSEGARRDRPFGRSTWRKPMKHPPFLDSAAFVGSLGGLSMEPERRPDSSLPSLSLSISLSRTARGFQLGKRNEEDRDTLRCGNMITNLRPRGVTQNRRASLGRGTEYGGNGSARKLCIPSLVEVQRRRDSPIAEGRRGLPFHQTGHPMVQVSPEKMVVLIQRSCDTKRHLSPWPELRGSSGAIHLLPINRARRTKSATISSGHDALQYAGSPSLVPIPVPVLVLVPHRTPTSTLTCFLAPNGWPLFLSPSVKGRGYSQFYPLGNGCITARFSAARLLRESAEMAEAVQTS